MGIAIAGMHYTAMAGLTLKPHPVSLSGAPALSTDGYDTGAPERLAAEMAQLRRRCRRIICLNPLLGWEG